MTTGAAGSSALVARLSGVTLHYGKTPALQGIDLQIPAGILVGLLGPDGVGKSSLLSLLAGARAVQEGCVEVLGGDMSDARHRSRVCPDIAYMPQGLGKNLYPTLSIEENLQFFGRLFGHGAPERRRRIDQLTAATGLHPFLTRPVRELSGGMMQKLGLCCALIHDPDLLILDEPTTGVDPLSRRQFWDLIAQIRGERHGMSVIVATAYMEEAERFELLLAMDAGRVLAVGTPRELHERTGAASLEEAFISLLPAEEARGHRRLEIPPLAEGQATKVVIEADDLTKRFGDFTAVDHVNFRIRQGEIFGFLGSNGCGKTTTMKMLAGLLPATAGKALLFGKEVDSRDIDTRRLVGYMSQSFSLYSELTVRQNLVLHARLFRVPEADIPGRVDEMITRFGLGRVPEALPASLPLGVRQRLSVAVAMVHKPQLLILDEPTSGVDPIARDSFWELLIALARKDKTTIFISTHFMNEGERCDRISLMHAGHVLVTDNPAELVRKRGVATLEDAFIAYIQDAERQAQAAEAPVTDAALTNAPAPAVTGTESAPARARQRRFSVFRALSYTLRETLELKRDPMRATLALLGSLILMLTIGLGINMDVENLSFAVLDRDQTTTSQSYALDLAGSRYFVEHRPIADYADLDRRMRSGELSLAIEIPPDFARDVARGVPVQIGVWMDGAMPLRAETVQGYVQGMHQHWLADKARQMGVNVPSSVSIETRFRYNPDVRSLPAMAPTVIPIMLLMIPAMLTALSVVREKELGSIINLYVTPVTRAEFLLGKQLPYIAVGMVNFLTMTLLAVTGFRVPITGSFAALALAAAAFVIFSTGFGLLVSTFTRTQVAGMFFAMIGTMIPAIDFAGLIYPVSSLEGAGRVIGAVYPATYFITVSRGVFNKALTLFDLKDEFLPMLAADVVVLALSIAFLKKQET